MELIRGNSRASFIDQINIGDGRPWPRKSAAACGAGNGFGLKSSLWGSGELLGRNGWPGQKVVLMRDSRQQSDCWQGNVVAQQQATPARGEDKAGGSEE